MEEYNDATYEETFNESDFNDMDDLLEEEFDICHYIPKFPSLPASRIIKYIVCQAINKVNREPGKYLVILPESLQCHMDEIVKIFRKLKRLNSAPTSEHIERDYPNVLKELSKNLPFHFILNEVLRELNEQFANGNYGRIDQANRTLYSNAINKIYEESFKALHHI